MVIIYKYIYSFVFVLGGGCFSFLFLFYFIVCNGVFHTFHLVLLLIFRIEGTDERTEKV